MSRLLLLGVSGKPDWALQSYWDLGGPGIFTSEHPFDFEYLPLPSSKYIAKYDLLGSVRAETSHPFDLGTVVAWYLENPFDFIANAPQPAIGITPTPPPLLPGQTPGPPPAFIPGIGIYSKAGIYIGSITKWSSVDARSIAIRDSGSSRFTVPIKTGLLGADNTELDLIQLDRIVVIGNNLGTPTWAGTISALEWGNGIVNVSCEDLFALGAGVEVGYSGGSVDPAAAPDPADSYAATEYAKQILLLNGEVAHIAVAKVISQINAFRSRDGEVLWELDATGSNTFFGDENISGDGLSTLATIADRSFSEYSWAVRVETTRMVPILVWRDAFTAPAGAALHDGVDANMDVNIMYRETSQPIINAIRITGSVTKIQNLIPEGAVVIPVAELIPVAEIWLIPVRIVVELTLASLQE